MGKWLAVPCLLASITASLPAAAGPRPEEIYFRYHAAIRAAVLCEGWRLEPKGYADPDWDRIAANRSRIDEVVHARVPGHLPAGRRLQLMQSARAEANRIVDAQGCEAGRVQGWLWMFHTDLEPVLIK
jgi:hypothetical protein